MKTTTFKIGERVSVIDENLTGLVVKILGSKVWISTNFGFEYCYEAKELIRVYGNFFNDKSVDLLLEAKERKKRKELLIKKVKKLKHKGILEIDLHIEKLLDFRGKYTQREWLSIQLIEAHKAIRSCMKKNRKQLIFIHGQGEGILKKALHELLDEYPNIEYFDASYRKYGTGATEIYIHYRL
ncbi:Smr/MutS family protein [Bacteroidetes bacterium endosymbiont of Geopemphigus sp.]|uniref:Smr/MutS family protein n=1 Tax=Bacteroidetes bacterium endosymbiont of Geopemphigus sp. TaxID=2047937 RepID=UPI000CD32CB7|nr:Smr/MutS family protein [Bacteroidetes bacterium endosymbiont of Geopemphigus sp.]